MSLISKIALRAIELINEQVAEGKNPDGSAFAPYSFGYWLKKRKKKSSAKTRKGRQAARLRFMTDWNSNPGETDLTKTGDMLSSLIPIETGTSKGGLHAVVGFTDKSAGLKAFYHNVSGAGKSRVLRRFMTLSPANELLLLEYAKSLTESDIDEDLSKLINDQLGVAIASVKKQ